jgi:phosphopantetheinyl transferase
MPIIQTDFSLTQGLQLALWQVTEQEDYFHKAREWSVADLAGFAAIKGARRLESMAARLALHQLTLAATPWQMEKDAHSKPYFPLHPDWHCALSHSHGIAAALLGSAPCGVDLQRYTGRMDKLAHKFVNPQEAALIAQHPAESQLDLLHLVWTAKEAMYKVHGRKSLDFKEHLSVHGFEANSSGMMKKGSERIACDLFFHWLELEGMGRWAICVARAV